MHGAFWEGIEVEDLLPQPSLSLGLTKWNQNTDEFGEGLGEGERGSIVGNRG